MTFVRAYEDFVRSNLSIRQAVEPSFKLCTSYGGSINGIRLGTAQVLTVRISYSYFINYK